MLFTGTIAMDRTEAMSRAAELGATIKSSASKRVSVLVFGEGAGEKEITMRSDAAAGLPVTFLTSEQFLETLLAINLAER